MRGGCAPPYPGNTGAPVGPPDTEEVVCVPLSVPDHVALAEIELCGELMIAASAAEEAGEDRLSPARIDEVLRVVRADGEEPTCPPRQGRPKRSRRCR